MDSEAPIDIFFFPYVGGGHQIPMIDMATIFAAHGAKSTIITTTAAAPSILNSVHRHHHHQSGLLLSVHALTADVPDVDMSATPSTDTSMLQEPLKLLLTEHAPDCIVTDMFHSWASDVIDGLGIPRIVFNGNGCFSRCVGESIRRHKPHEKVDSDTEIFIVPGLPDQIELTRSQIPIFVRNPGGFQRKMGNSDEKSFGVVVNSFYELEQAYADHFKKEMGKKSWLIGPVSLCNKNLADKAERGKQAAIDEKNCLNWLDSKELNSVLYISFGSLARMAPAQLIEIAYGLEASNCSFIWVIGKIKNEGGESNWVPEGFEEKLEKSRKGLMIRGWAPQLLILEHAAVGGFMTHCGWNSTLESVSAGVPMITWPLSAEQFYNEKLITDVLKIGVKVGSLEWASWNMEAKELVGREKVAAVVERLMGGDGGEAAEMRRRAREIGEKAKRAVELGGSSYGDADALIEELKSLRRSGK